MSSIYRRRENGVWYLQWFDRGSVHKKSLRTRDRNVAKREQRAFDGEKDLVDHGLVDPRLPLDEVFRRWMTTKPSIKERTFKRYHEIWRRVLRFFDGQGISGAGRVTSSHLTAYVALRMSESAATKTIAEELQLVKAIMRWALEQGMTRSIPQSWPRVKTTVAKPERVGAYTTDEVRQILEHFRDTLHWHLLCFLAWTGVRRSEAMELRVADVDLAREVVRIESGKTARTSLDQFREIEIHPELAPALRERILGKRPEAHVFDAIHRWDGVTDRLRVACRRLGIRYRRLHGLRHSWISRMLAAGCPLSLVMYMAGHSCIATTQRYLTVQVQTGWVKRI